MDLGLKDRVAVVTGGGRGIGRRIVLTLAEEGAKVAVLDFYEERAKAVTDEVTANGGTAVAVTANITNIEEVQNAIKEVQDKLGPVEILCNNAGNAGIMDPTAERTRVGGLFVEMDQAGWHQWLGVNFFGNLNCTKVVIQQMIEQKYGKIVNTISDAGRIGEPRQSVYSGAKAGIVGFSKALAKEVGRYCINVNCVSPGATYTEATLGNIEGGDNRSQAQKDREQTILRVYPLGRGLQRLGTPADVANAVVFLTSDRAAWITGQVLSVSGGYTTVG